MTVITGETGAGKTLIVDALDLLCGGRADPRLSSRRRRRSARRRPLRRRRRRGRARARRARDRAHARLHRRPARDRRRARASAAVPSSTCTASTRTSRCSVPAEQRALLDRFAGEPAAAARARRSAARARRRRASRSEQAADRRRRPLARARQLDLLRYELEEIDAAAIDDADEDAALAAEEEILADAEAHREALKHAHAPARRRGAGRARRRDRRARPDASPFAAIADRLRALQIEAAEAAHDVRVPRPSDRRRPATAGRRAAAPRAPARARPQVRPDARRRAGLRDRGAARLAQLEGPRRAAAPARGRRRRRRAAPSPRRPRGAVGGARRAAAGPLAAAVEGNLRDAGDAGARVRGRVEPGDLARRARTAPTTSCSCWRRTRASRRGPLAGRPPAASWRARCSHCGSCSPAAPPTLVFDEVDAGIGGEAGTAVGRALATLGGQHQVLCVTHLPQVAGVRRRAGRGGEGRGRWAHRRERGAAARRRARRRVVAHARRASASRRTRAATPRSCSPTRARHRQRCAGETQSSGLEFVRPERDAVYSAPRGG